MVDATTTRFDWKMAGQYPSRRRTYARLAGIDIMSNGRLNMLNEEGLGATVSSLEAGVWCASPRTSFCHAPN